MGYNAYNNYNNYNMVNIDTALLQRLGFSPNEIQQLTYVYNNGGKFTPSALQSYGYNYEQARRLSYMYNICAGRVQVDSQQQMVKHLRKVFGSGYRISIQDLAVSKITSVPMVALVANIKEEPYNIWNSKNYKGKDAIYKVIDVTGQKITVETKKKPRLEYGKPKVLPGILEIKGVKENGNAIVTFDKKYCRLCNRFIIVASLRNPEFHLGKYQIVCFEGTKVYVYALNMGTKSNTRYNMGTQRVYDYGLFPQDIKGKLTTVAKNMYNHLKGVDVQFEGANQDYLVINPEKHDNLEDDDIVE